MNTSRNSDHLENLIVGHFERTLTPAQEQELAKAISKSEEAKQLFLSHMRMEGRLHSLGRDGFLRVSDQKLPAATGNAESQAVASSRSERRTNSRFWKVLASLTACLFLIVAITWSVYPQSASASTVLQKAQLAAAELIDRTYRLVISRSRTGEEPIERELEINLRGEGQFLVRPQNSAYVMGSNGTDFWMARKSGPIAVTEDYQALSPELKKRIPNRWLLDVLASPEEPLFLNFPKLLTLIEQSCDIELVESDDPDSRHLRATFRKSQRSKMKIIDLWIAKESGVILKAEILTRYQSRVQFELLESMPLSDQWYQYDWHFPDRKVKRVKRTTQLPGR